MRVMVETFKVVCDGCARMTDIIIVQTVTLSMMKTSGSARTDAGTTMMGTIYNYIQN